MLLLRVQQQQQQQALKMQQQPHHRHLQLMVKMLKIYIIIYKNIRHECAHVLKKNTPIVSTQGATDSSANNTDSTSNYGY